MYAENTSVPVEKTKAEIESAIVRFGADRFMAGTESGSATIAFQFKNRVVRFVLTLPRRDEKRFWQTPARGNKRNESEAFKLWEQACRASWRALFLVIKAKIEAVERGITTFDREFMAHYVLPNGLTIADALIPQIEEMAEKKTMPRLLLTA